jgi:hypothetical protein
MLCDFNGFTLAGDNVNAIAGNRLRDRIPEDQCQTII